MPDFKSLIPTFSLWEKEFFEFFEIHKYREHSDASVKAQLSDSPSVLQLVKTLAALLRIDCMLNNTESFSVVYVEMVVFL